MTVSTSNTTSGLASRLVDAILSIKPLADFAKYQARTMMIKRAEAIGVPWRENVRQLQLHDWESELIRIENSQLNYPDYYLTSFHAYPEGNLNWDAAWELESAARAVHAKIWQDAGAQGDSKLRQSYHQILKQQILSQPQRILDLGCGVGLSTFTLQQVYPEAKVTGLDLSPYFLSVANYRDCTRRRQSYRESNAEIDWVHASAEATGLPDTSFDLISACLVFHELPQTAAKAILVEARRLLGKGGYLCIMDMNPGSEAFAKMPPYIFTLLRSTEPYLREYFTLDLDLALIDAGFQAPTITINSPRHRTVIARVS
jgi:ubiquinone/menaquinone biosynthesis C-methylase UbiE